MEALIQDLRYATKLLWKEKAFSATVLLTLALCVGANAAIFGVIRTVLLDPLPFDQPDRLVRVTNSYPNAGVERASNSGPDYFFRRERIGAFQEVAAYQYWGHTIGEEGAPSRVRSLRVTPSLFPLLGVRPLLGRTFTEDEDEPATAQKVILSHGYWQERFGGDPGAVGADLRVDGRPFTVVGVLPASFRFLGERDNQIYVPIPFEPVERTVERLHSNNYEMIARLAPGATAEQAVAEIGAMDAALVEEIPIPNARQVLEDAGYTVIVRDLKADLLRDVGPTLYMLWAGVIFVLLIGCANIANLMLTRASVRGRELATRISLGADRVRLARQLVTESLLMAVLGGALGLAVGGLGLQLLSTVGVQELPRGTQVGIDAGVVLFTLLLAATAGVLFGAVPVAHLFRADLNTVFRSESRGGTAGRRAVLVRNALVASQVAIALVLLVGAGLMFASFRAALRVDPGFEPEGVLTGYISLPDSRYEDGAARRTFADELLREVRAIPGVEVASVTSQLPFTDNASSSVVLPEGYVPEAGESFLSPLQTVVAPGYFQTMGIPVLSGRGFEVADDETSTQVMVIDQWLAERYWPGESPLGRRMFLGVPGGEEDQEAQMYTIVGVVGVIKQHDLTDESHAGAYYFVYPQQTRSFLTLAVRAAGAPTALVSPIREAVARIDPDLPFYQPETMEQRIDESLVSRRAPMVLLLAFAAVALFLATVGIYGVLAYTVTQRTREVGLRMALGGGPRRIFGMVVRQGVRVLAVGLGIGLVAALVGMRFIQGLLYGVGSADPLVLGGVVLLLAGAGLAACMVPARRAVRLDPMEALAEE
jgi:predicted permease